MGNPNKNILGLKKHIALEVIDCLSVPHGDVMENMSWFIQLTFIECLLPADSERGGKHNQNQHQQAFLNELKIMLGAQHCHFV